MERKVRRPDAALRMGIGHWERKRGRFSIRVALLEFDIGPEKLATIIVQRTTSDIETRIADYLGRHG
jgi:hypothetical protein